MVILVKWQGAVWRTGKAEGRVANDAGALIGEIEEGGGALVVRHDRQGAQQYDGVRGHAAAAVLTQQRKDRPEVAPCQHAANSDRNAVNIKPQRQLHVCLF